MKKPVESSVAWIDPATGKPTQYFLELIQNLSANGLTMPVAATAPANGDVLTFNGTTNKWEPA